MPVISLSNHPSNIAVFAAASFRDARGKAHQHNDRPRIQASVWITSPDRIDWEKEEKLTYAFERALGLDTDPNKTTVIIKSMSGKNSFGFQRQAPVPHDLLDLTRQRNLEVLGRATRDVQLAVRHTMAGVLNKHHDRDEKENEGRNAGHKNRIIHARNGAGTWVYDLAGRAWEIAGGSYLFLNNRDSAADKSLLHSNPVFRLSTGANPRTVDVYDF